MLQSHKFCFTQRFGITFNPSLKVPVVWEEEWFFFSPMASQMEAGKIQVLKAEALKKIFYLFLLLQSENDNY